MAVVTDTPTSTPPCGACRQLLCEFAPDAEVVLANLAGDLLPLVLDESKPGS